MNDGPGLFQRIVKWFAGVAVALVVLLVVLILAILSPGLYNRWVFFPKQKAAWETIRKSYQEVTAYDGWSDFKGSTHSHSEISHDSDASFEDILATLKSLHSDFALMSDHFVNGKADWSLGRKGIYDGVLFIRGFEMQEGLMPWGLPDSMIMDEKEDVGEVAAKIKAQGGIVTFAHCEQERRWDLPELEAMEVYNIHATFLEKRHDTNFLWKTGVNVLTCLNTYGDQCFYALFERPDNNIKRWDDLNISRHITGYAGNDTHQNCGFQGKYTDDGNLITCDTGHTFEERGQIVKLNFFTRTLLRLFCGPLEPGKLLFRFDLDKYARSAIYVRTHLLAKANTEKDILEALRAGRAYFAWDMVADSTGFVYMAEGASGRAVMGESIPLDSALTLTAFCPYECKFELMRNGIKVDEKRGRTYSYKPADNGKYRLEVSLNVLGKDVLWLLTNPIAVDAP